MAVDISLIVIAIAAVVLVVFLVLTLIQTRKTLKATKSDLHRVSLEAVVLMKKIEALTSDIKSKSESLDFAFRPLEKINRERLCEECVEEEQSDTVEQVCDWISISLALYKKIKIAVKEYERD